MYVSCFVLMKTLLVSYLCLEKMIKGNELNGNKTSNIYILLIACQALSALKPVYTHPLFSITL